MSAGKGDTPRPVSLQVYHQNYDAIFRKSKRPIDDNPFESADHDNDCDTYNERISMVASETYEEWVSRAFEERNNLILHACRVSSVCRQLKDKIEQYRRHTDTIITLLEIVEETDDGRPFSPNCIQSSRSHDLQKIGEAITHLKMLNE